MIDNIHILGLLALTVAVCFDIVGGYMGVMKVLRKGGPSSVALVTLPVYFLIYGLNPEFSIFNRLVDAVLILLFHFSMHIFIPSIFRANIR